MYFLHMANLFSLMLFIAGILSITNFIINVQYYNLYTGIVFILVAFVNAGLEFLQEWRSAVILKELAGLVPTKVRCIREGSLSEVELSQLVRGDIVLLKRGDKVPADMRLLSTADLKLDMSSITGESEPQERHASTQPGIPFIQATNIAFSGALVLTGEAVGMVIRTGKGSFIGRITNLAISVEPTPTLLTQQVTVFVRRSVTFGTILGLISLVIAFSRGLYVTFVFDVVIGVIVNFLPQGLPLTITILLNHAVREMADRNVLAKNVHAVETLGCITALATDKTGTLTQNIMTINQLWCDFDGTQIRSSESVDHIPEEWIKGTVLCAATKYDENEASTPYAEIQNFFGDATEIGILRFVGRFCDPRKVEAEHEKTFEIPFNSSNKYHFVQAQQKGVNRVQTFSAMKGAPEIVLGYCKYYCSTGGGAAASGSRLLIDDEFRDRFGQTYEKLASQGLRSVALAVKGDDEQLRAAASGSTGGVDLPKDLTFSCLFSLQDPPKEGVKDAIEACHRAGVRVIMVTGDHPLTAVAIARQVGIIKPGAPSNDPEHTEVAATYRSLTGEDLDSFEDTEWKRLMTSDIDLVFARTLPRHKLAIVRHLQAVGHIVGVTGDGVNDSPALRVADLGISMNKSGSDISKEVASLIILDDKFATIVEGIFQGRLIFENVRKSIRYLISHILPVSLALFIFTITLIPLPISPLLVLVIDLIADVLSRHCLCIRARRIGPYEPTATDQERERPTRWILDFCFARPG